MLLNVKCNIKFNMKNKIVLNVIFFSLNNNRKIILNIFYLS